MPTLLGGKALGDTHCLRSGSMMAQGNKFNAAKNQKLRTDVRIWTSDVQNISHGIILIFITHGFSQVMVLGG
ncbi:hypothetical protein C5167_023268 [Papaver somniferum]|uniref:Uncharacterized protein n=1 Tax=Papaver somniferum TaxID=3469 RepID=A0A4Y7JNC4_PAPSO|nr:hypothetical protein C5167_023268 [Papaver somniferum]